MPLTTLSLIAGIILCTSFVSGIFGVAGGMILMGLLVAFLPVATAMTIHGVSQMTSNAWRAIIWHRYTAWPIFRYYLAGLALATAAFWSIRYVPSKQVVYLALGIMPFVTLLLPARWMPRIDRPAGGVFCGFANAAMQLTAGVSGAFLDAFFARTTLDRRGIVATKATCQMLTHGTKLVYFLQAGAALDLSIEAETWAIVITASITGTMLGRLVLEKMTNVRFRQATRWLVMTVGTVYLIRGLQLLLSGA